MGRFLLYHPLLWVLALSSCLSDGSLKRPYEGYSPREKGDGWEISSPEKELMDHDLLNQAFQLVYSENRFLMAKSLLVARHGKLVAEAYPSNPDDIDKIENIQSCTKTITSMVTGIAMQNGLLDSVGQKLSDIYPEHFINVPDKEEITLEHALTMRTGLEFNNDTYTLGLYQSTGSSVEFVLSKDVLYQPGQVFHYNDGSPHLVSAAIGKKAGTSMGAYAGQHLFKPLGINEWQWEEAKDGVTFGAFSLYLKPRDMLKIGQLLLNKGLWNGTRVVDSTWISEATAIRSTANFNTASYGYYFWIFPAEGAFAAEGHGGQIIYVVPQKELVIVYSAWGYTSSMLWDQYTELTDLIISSCE